MKRTFNGIDYHYIDPTGNITILVESAVPALKQTETARILLEKERDCEQVGFIAGSDTCDTKLRMAAGEFCGNATMSAAALFCDKAGLEAGKTRKVIVDPSGCRENIQVDITRKSDEDMHHVYCGSVHMPCHNRITEQTLEYKGSHTLPVVEFDGIMHIIAQQDVLDLSDAEAEEAIKIWGKKLGADCIGLMTVSADKLRPLVYVPAVGSCYWERSCASGTTAAGAYYFEKGMDPGPGISFTEPGGVLSVTKDNDNRVVLTGTVRL